MPEENNLLGLNPKDKEVLRLIKSIKYGSVLVVIHNSKIVQVELTNKIPLFSRSQIYF